jgi:hypothetical protein
VNIAEKGKCAAITPSAGASMLARRLLGASILTLLIACGDDSSRDESTKDAGSVDDAIGQAGDSSDSASPDAPGGGGDDVSSEDASSDRGGTFDCNDLRITCADPRPSCPPRHMPVVEGGCWAGFCVPGSDCRSDIDCSVCDFDTEVCAKDWFESGYSRSRCFQVPPECSADRTCRCLASTMCAEGPGRSCGDNGNGREFGCFCLC